MRKCTYLHIECAIMHVMKSDWEDIKTVLHLVREKSLAASADSLGVTYTTVSRRVAKAEESMGQVLFQRSSAGYVPSEAGLEVARIGGLMEAHMDQLSRHLSAAPEKLEGELRITAPQLLVASHLAPVLNQLRKRYPGILPEVLATNELLDLKRPSADVAIRISNSPGDSYSAMRLANQTRASYANRKVARRIKTHPEEVVEWIGMPHWKTPPKASLVSYPHAKISYRFDDMTAVVGAAEAGLGVASMPRFIGDGARGLVQIPVLPPQPFWDIWVVSHPDMRNAPKVRAFKEILVPYFRKRQSDFVHE